MKKEKIGILGGTFNPIHTGHLILAENAYDEFHLNKVWIMPSGCSYFKDQQRIVSGEHRMQMISLAIEKNPHFELSTLEIYRPGNTYTYETIHFLKEHYTNTDFYFILGEDSLFQIETWKCPKEIFSGCTLLVACREERGANNHTFSPHVSVKEKILSLCNEYNAAIYTMGTPHLGISSEKIRRDVFYGKSIKYYVPYSVENYIYENKLYKENSQSERK